MLMHSRCSCFHLLMTDDVQVPTPALLSLYDDLTLMTTTFDAMLTTTVPKIDDPDDNNYEHLWSSGTTYPCHGWDPGSIPGKCTFWLIHTDFPSSYPFYFDIDHRPVRLYTFLRRPSVFSMCKMLMRPPTTMRPVPFRLLFLSQDAVLNTRCFLLMTILNSTLYTTQHSCADSSFPLQYRAEQSRAVHFPTDRCPDKTFWCLPEMPRLLF